MFLNAKKYLVLFIVLGLSAKVALAQHNALKTFNTAEPLYGIQMGEGKVTIQVKSNGCTRGEHFKFKITKSTTAAEPTAENELTIQRLGKDQCRRMPFLLSINLPLPESHGPFKLMNPLKVWRIKKRQ